MINAKQANELKKMLVNEMARLEKSVHSYLEERPAMEPGEPAAELSMYDNHPADMGTEMFDRLKDQAIGNHTETEIDFIKEALDAIENGSYGKCKVCGKDISYERLKVLPYTLYCVDHTPRKNLPDDRPVEEEVLPLHGPDFSHLHNPQYDMREDTFEEIGKFGTSETPSDMGNDKEDYLVLYEKDDRPEGFTEDYESFIGNEMDGERRIYPNKAEEDLERKLDEEKLESQIGNLPYKLKDSYTNET